MTKIKVSSHPEICPDGVEIEVQPDHALQAAIDGEGVVLGWRCLASNDIAAGRLIQPFSLALPLGLFFYLVYPGAYENKPEINAFRDWLMEEP